MHAARSSDAWCDVRGMPPRFAHAIPRPVGAHDEQPRGGIHGVRPLPRSSAGPYERALRVALTQRRMAKVYSSGRTSSSTRSHAATRRANVRRSHRSALRPQGSRREKYENTGSPPSFQLGFGFFLTSRSGLGRLSSGVVGLHPSYRRHVRLPCVTAPSSRRPRA